MADEYNPYLKSPEELDSDLEANSRALKRNIVRKQLRDYIIFNEDIENSIEENEIDSPGEQIESGAVCFSPGKKKSVS